MGRCSGADNLAFLVLHLIIKEELDALKFLNGNLDGNLIGKPGGEQCEWNELRMQVWKGQGGNRKQRVA